jgi:type IV fimbrial biogenesis protein FimT
MTVTHRQFPANKLTQAAGFTLLELMVVVSIAAILMAIAVPSFNATIRSNRLTSDANQFTTALNLARSEAVKRGLSVTVRKIDNLSSTNGGVAAAAAANWENGWDVFVDQNANGAFNDDGDATLCETAPAEDCLLKTYAALQTNYTLRGSGAAANFANYITYSPAGRSHTNGSFIVCDNRDGTMIPIANTSRFIIVNLSGRARMGLDLDIPADNIPNTPGAANIASCTPVYAGS